jgi:hypothetical protein
VRTLSIEAASSASAQSLRVALAPFGADLIEHEGSGTVVRVKLSGANGEITALLNAIQDYVSARSQGPTVIELDGRSYLMDELW